MDETNVWERFLETLEHEEAEQIAYVYKVDSHGKPVKPFWLKTYADSLLEPTLVCEGGDFLVMIRRGRKMVFSGRLSFFKRHPR